MVLFDFSFKFSGDNAIGQEIQELSPSAQQTVLDQARKIFGGDGPVRYDVQWDAMLRKLERDSRTDWRV